MLTSCPHLSVVIPSHRRTDLLRLCLESVARHAPPVTEIIVVDDGSPGGSVSDVASHFPGVRVLRFSRQSGFCVAANRGLAAARAPIVELLNDDTQVFPGWAEPALRCFADASVGAVAPLVLKGPTDAQRPRIDSAGDVFDPGGFYRKRGHGQPLAARWLRPGPVCGASGSSAFYRRSALQRVGLFPEEFGAYFEDVDLSHRLTRGGYSVVYEPASRVWHRVGASHHRGRGRRLLERQSCNEERVFWRNTLARSLAWHLPRHFAVLAGKALLRSREGTLIPFVMGRLRVLADLPALVRHRRRLAGLSPDTSPAPAHG